MFFVKVAVRPRESVTVAVMVFDPDFVNAPEVKLWDVYVASPTVVR